MSGAIKNLNKLLKPLGNSPSLYAFSLDQIPSQGDIKSNKLLGLSSSIKYMKNTGYVTLEKADDINTSPIPSRSTKVKKIMKLTSRTMAVHTLFP